LDCPNEGTWTRRRRPRRYGLPPVHLPYWLGRTLPQLKQLIHGIEKLTQELEEQRTRAANAEYSLAALQAQMQEYESRNGIGGWIEEEEEEEEPMETHWDKGTQTENEMDRFLPIKKRSIRAEEESP
jgi:phage shock protein A